MRTDVTTPTWDSTDRGDCPLCGERSPSAENRTGSSTRADRRPRSSSAHRILVVGDAPTARSVVDGCRRFAPDSHITVVTGDAGWKEHAVEILGETKVDRIDADKKRLILAGGAESAFDSLILAGGGTRTVPPFHREDLGGVTLLGSSSDVPAIAASCRPGLPAAVIGGGALGVEAAHAMAERGARVTIYEKSAWLLPDELDERGGATLAEVLERLGIEVSTGATVQALEGSNRVRGVRLGRRARSDAELVVVATESTPDVGWLTGSGVACGRGVIVDAQMRTSTSSIYAIGSAAEFHGRTFARPALVALQARVAAAGAAGTRCDAFIPSTSLDCAGIPVLSIGEIHDSGHATTTGVVSDSVRKTYRKVVFRNGLPIGGLLVNTRDGVEEIRQLVEAGSRIERLTPIALSTASPAVEL